EPELSWSRERGAEKRSAIGQGRDRGRTTRPKSRRAPPGAAGRAAGRPGAVRLPARGPVPETFLGDHVVSGIDLLRDPARHGDLGGAPDRSHRLSPAHL